MRCKKSFTLVEMVVVLGIVLILVTLVLPPLSSMWRQSQVANAHQRVRNFVRLAKARSMQFEYSSYGILFYIDPETNRENMVFIKDKTVPFYPDEKYPEICDRYEIDQDSTPAVLDDFVRVAPFESLSWDSEKLSNQDYKHSPHRNFFGIIFQRGEFSTYPFILYDRDADADGRGDLTNLDVATIPGPLGGVLRHTVFDENNICLNFNTTKGFVVYDESEFKSMPDFNLVFHTIFHITPHGEIVALRN